MPTYLPPRNGISQSAALAQAYASAIATQPELVTLAFYHSSFKDENGNTSAIYVVNDWNPLVATLESDAEIHASSQVTFQPIPFKFIRPNESDGSSSPEVTIELDNVSKEVTPYLSSASKSKEPIRLVCRIYLANDTSAPHEIPPMSLVMRNVTVTNTTITAKAGYGDLINRRFPGVEFLPRTHPGLVAS